MIKKNNAWFSGKGHPYIYIMRIRKMLILLERMLYSINYGIIGVLSSPNNIYSTCSNY